MELKDKCSSLPPSDDELGPFMTSEVLSSLV